VFAREHPELLWNGFLAVKTCSKDLLTVRQGHGKSPCFLQVAFLQLLSPDYLMAILLFVDGQENM
jgi:hypothetical protein